MNKSLRQSIRTTLELGQSVANSALHQEEIQAALRIVGRDDQSIYKNLSGIVSILGYIKACCYDGGFYLLSSEIADVIDNVSQNARL